MEIFHCELGLLLLSPRVSVSTSPVPTAASSAHIEYVTPPGSAPLDGTTSAVVIADDGEVLAEAPMDVPGATVEVIATPSHNIVKPIKKRGAPAYREQLLLR